MLLAPDVVNNLPPLAAILSFVATGMLVLLVPQLPRLAGAPEHLSAVQSAHKKITPRVGGLAIFFGLCVMLVFLPWKEARIYGGFFLAASVLFMAGILEDLGFGVSPTNRLVAAVISSLLVVGIFGTWLTRVDIPGLESFVQYWFVGVPITILLTAGIANGFNLIDGVNGLSSVVAIVSSLALSFIAYLSGDIFLAQAGLILAAAVFGFFALNFPFGLIFLGDAGAYTLGFFISWLGIFVVIGSTDVTPWAVLLTVIWPVSDTMLAIYRRSRRQADTMAPDRLHVHQLVMRAIEIVFVGRSKRHISNPLTTVILTPCVLAPALAAVAFWNSPLFAFLSVVTFKIIFWGTYLSMFRVISRYRRGSYRRAA
ncbi:glycosyltransferase [Roseivivax sp. THAF197b]|uniref:MraY family glycosyltransferase n=1 Tax=Roseivivax sp. THAF197b TaxID=2588299 RepID=UPI00126930F1|nr:glycosyltransferase [Roseivivax sp. THAF197b]